MIMISLLSILKDSQFILTTERGSGMKPKFF